MRIYLSQTDNLRTEKGETLPKILQRLGAHVVDKEDEADFNKVDAVIVSGHDENSQQAYIIALALAKQKSVLYLLAKGGVINTTVESLRGDKRLQEYFSFSYFTKNKLAGIVESFVRKSEKGNLAEVPSIKFTLRITPSIERYLQWKSKELGLSKADFLRNVIEEDVMGKDKNYKRS